LALPGEAFEALRSGALSAGHARAVLAVEGEHARLEALREILHKGLSVRQAEALAKRKGAKKPRVLRRKDPNLQNLEDRLSKRFATRISIEPAKKKGAGKIFIPYQTLDDLDRILDLLTGRGA
jgi:ParB family chromosome partitioning protein